MQSKQIDKALSPSEVDNKYLSDENPLFQLLPDENLGSPNAQFTEYPLGLAIDSKVKKLDSLKDIENQAEVIDLSDNNEESQQVLNDQPRRRAIFVTALECLKNSRGREAWLNDDVVNRYLYTELPKIDENVMVVESLMWSDVYNFNPDTVRNMVYPEYKQSWSFAVFPINVNNSHWTLAIAESTGLVRFFDSMSGEISEEQKRKIALCVRGFCDYEVDVDFEIVDSSSYYQQDNWWNCGPAVCMLAERFLSNESLKFNGTNVFNWRRHALKVLKENFRIINLNGQEVLNEAVNKSRKSATYKIKREKKRKSVQVRRDNETSDQKADRNQKDANRKKLTRANETPHQKAVRNQKDADSKKRQRPKKLISFVKLPKKNLMMKKRLMRILLCWTLVI